MKQLNYKNLLLSIAILGSATILQAATLKVTPVASKKVVVGNVTHVGENRMQFQLVLEEETEIINSVEVAKITFTPSAGGDSYDRDITYRIQNGVLTLNDVELSKDEIQRGAQYKALVSLSYTTTTAKSLTPSTEFALWGEADAQQNGNSTRNVVHGQKISDMGITTVGGYMDKDGWTYKWNKGGSMSSQYGEYTANNTSTNMTTDNISVAVTNVAPDGSKWFDKSFTYTINVYPTPYATQSPPTSYIMKDKDQQTFTITPIGGNPDGWSYDWSTGAKTNQLQYKAQNNTATAIDNKITVTVVNKSPDGKEEWYNETFTYDVKIYPEPTVSLAQKSDLYVLNNKTKKLDLNVAGGNPDGWSYNWSTGANTKSIEYTATGADEFQHDNRVTVTVINTSPDGKEWKKVLLSYTVHTYPRPSAEASTATQFSNKVDDDVVALGVSHKGGNNEGWNIVWSDKQNGEEIDYKVVNKEKTAKTLNVIATVTNKSPDNETWYNQEFPYTIDVLPYFSLKANASFGGDIITECFSDDEINLHAQAEGYNENGWEYQWEDNATSGADFTVKVPTNNGTSPINKTYKITATNTDNDGTQRQKDTSVTLHIYSRGNVTVENLDSINFLAGQPINLRSTTTGGYPTGWTYEWYDGTQKISSKANDQLTTPTSSSTKIEKTYRLVARNKIGNNTGQELTTLTTQKFTVWPLISLPVSIMEIPTEIRENNPYSGSINIPEGGHTAVAWQYSWKRDGSQFATTRIFDTTANMTRSSNNKGTENTTITLNLKQMGPNGKLWVDKDYTQDVTIYRRPQLPKNVVRKGNGTTHTLIVNTDISEDQLFGNLGYKFGFGYTDKSGNDHLSDYVERRYFQMSQQDFANTDSQIWATSVWQYDNGTIVTSGRCYLDGKIDNSFDNSTIAQRTISYLPFKEYNTSGIEDLTGCKLMEVNGNELKISNIAASNTVINVYSLNGALVQHNDITTEGETSIDLSNLSGGMYIVEVSNGMMREVKKVVVR